MDKDNIIDPFDDVWRCIRNISRKNTLIVVTAMYNNGHMTFGELRKKTGIDSNPLNHTLADMGNLYLLSKNENKKYCLTKYCAVLYETFLNINRFIESSEIDTLLEAHNTEEDDHGL
jgi:DNA-binding HxlR family transcriptional regulator